MKAHTLSSISGAVLTALLGIGATAPAHAYFGIGPVLVAEPTYDAKIYPGAGCQAFDGDQEVDLNHVGKSSFIFQLFPLPAIKVGGTWNEATTPRKITCPIVRDNISNADGTFGVLPTPRPVNPGPGIVPGPFLGVNLWVNNQGAAGALSCTLNSNDAYGTVQALDTTVAPAGLSEIFLDVNLSVTQTGHYTIECTLPQNSSLFSYRVIERLPTDQNN